MERQRENELKRMHNSHFYYSAQAAAAVASTLVSAVAFLMGMAF